MLSVLEWSDAGGDWDEQGDSGSSGGDGRSWTVTWSTRGFTLLNSGAGTSPAVLADAGRRVNGDHGGCRRLGSGGVGLGVTISMAVVFLWATTMKQ